ncbi:UbiH/UbiF family hydroxylase [Tianweitania populi]|uniref:2-octaprenyl-6-methoxyphenyl hydroxylase n=1 Tax=Tianweitania populi TaxID=1607949 RepID=A0A8J3GJE1_9HYPH|nr:UbiH/UbiF family hydroxylase [Tianweitania populi]GHD08928.1 2-octaprenyl-6-methoxyphenyl hydroxylase [Tianweitania populi]
MTDMLAPKTILVAGAGPAGLIASLAMAKAGFDVSLIGPEAGASDARTTAVMVPALDYLAELGIDTSFEGKSAPLRTMRIIDATKRLLRSPTVTFHASEIDRNTFGANIPNAVLARTLSEVVANQPRITRHLTTVQNWVPSSDRITAVLDDGMRLEGALAIAADGRGSPARDAAGIRTIGHPYPQSALVLSFSHTRPHNDTSNEFHTETGPFTQVPLPGDKSSLVWVVSPAEAEMLTALDDAELSRRIEVRMQSMLGSVTVLPGRQIYPLSARMPLSFAQSRIALVGEAAHVFPPIGAQGLNLGIRDVQTIAGLVEENLSDAGADSVLRSYSRRRTPDIFARNSAVNLLNRSLLSGLLPAQMARSAGLSLMEKLPPVRSFFMREGMSPGSGFRGLWEKVGRQDA